MNHVKKLLPLLIIGLIPLQTIAYTNIKKDTTKVHIVGTDQMKFTVTSIKASPGELMKVTLTTKSDFPPAAMSHDFVLLTQNSDAQKVAQSCAHFRDNDYIDPDMKKYIVAHTALAGGGETVSVTFHAPQKPGDYEYICTFPGHFSAGMKGTLTVKAD